MTTTTTTTTLRRLQQAGLVATALAVSGAQGLWLGGGLTILTKNLLDAAENTNNTAALLISQPSPFSAASTACSLLSESLWTPTSPTSFTTALAPALAYQSYLDLFPPTQLYWIAAPSPSDSPTCRAISASGAITDSLPCDTNLPALCTQSAPASTNKISNATTTWQLAHVVGNATVRGYRDYHVFKFRGLRFAEPPRRFGYSVASTAFDRDGEEVDATVAGADCSQPVADVPHGTSEDCLFANVWTPYLPRTADSKAGRGREHLKPVMVYVYGGGLRTGTGKSTVTDGTNLASRGDVVVVTVNYRVGTLGFLNLNDGVHKGNYAVSDWLSALQWVNKYIEYFGGDPSRVTLFGESAGGMATHAMMGVAQAKGLFHRVIKMSSPDGYPGDGRILRYMRYEELEDNYNGFTKAVLRDAGCANATDVVACLGKLSGFELVNLKTNANGFVKDGTYLKNRELVVNQTEASYVTDVPVMIGVNRDEAGIDIDADKYPSDNITLAEYFDKVFTPRDLPADATKLLGLDKPANVSTYVGLPLPANMTTINSLLTPEQIIKTAVRIASVSVFNCYAMAQAVSGAKHKSFGASYFYTFNRTYGTNGYTRPWCNAPKTAARPNGDPDGEYMKCHASEMPLFFGTALRNGYPDRDGLDVPFMQLLIDYWAAYARTGDPNPPVEYLKVRGHAHTLGQVEKTGRWEPVDPEKPTQRWLQWNGGQRPFMDGPVCDMLGAPLDVFER